MRNKLFLNKTVACLTPSLSELETPFSYSFSSRGQIFLRLFWLARLFLIGWLLQLAPHWIDLIATFCLQLANIRVAKGPQKRWFEKRATTSRHQVTRPQVTSPLWVLQYHCRATCCLGCGIITHFKVILKTIFKRTRCGRGLTCCRCLT